MKDSIKVAVAGDIMPSGVLYGSDKDAIHADVINKLKGADIRIGNLECALGPYCDTPHFDPEKMSRLKDVVWAVDEDLDRVIKMGFDILCLANNHIYDLDKEGMKYTINLLKRKGIKHCGAGMNINEASKPAVIEVKGKTVAVLSFCDYREETVGYVPFATETKPGVNPLYPMEYSCSEVKKYKVLYDYVIVVPHWGIEKTWKATQTVLDDAKKLIEVGADAVMGGHPHRIQSSFYYNSKPIYPSLGNFFFPDRYLNSPRPTWYPLKGTDTSTYPRKYGYPWVTEPTVKVWPYNGRIGMVAQLTFEERKIRKDDFYVYLTEENELITTNLSHVLPFGIICYLQGLKLSYKFNFVRYILNAFVNVVVFMKKIV